MELKNEKTGQRGSWLWYLLRTTFFCLVGLMIGQVTIGFIMSAALHLVAGSFYPAMNEQAIEVIADNCSFCMVAILLGLYIRKKEKKGLIAFCFEGQRRKLPMAVLGGLAGVLLCTASILVAIFTGNLTIAFQGIDPFVVLLVLGSGIVQSFTEEVLFRGYLLGGLRKEYTTGTAILWSSILFSVIHVINPGITPLAVINIVMTGLVFACLVVKLNSLGFVIGIHVMWNFTQEILFGLPNSGISFSKSIFAVEASENSLIYDQAFGIEATLQCLIVWGVVLAIILLTRREKKI